VQSGEQDEGWMNMVGENGRPRYLPN